MRALFGSTFLIATLAGSFAAQAGSILSISPRQGSAIAAVLAFLDHCRAEDSDYVAAPDPSAAAHRRTFAQQARPVSAALAAPQFSSIAGGLPNLSAVLSGIHHRHPSILRL